MHSYGDKNFSDELFAQVDDAAEYIGKNLRRWGRINVLQTKEKFGTVRCYMNFGWSCFHSLVWPGWCRIHQYWPYKLDLALSCHIMPVLSKIAIPIQISIYRYFYQKAIDKWPHLAEEIISCADAGEMLEGLVLKRYKHSDYWTEVK